jgi:hypothetical protein
MDASSDMIGQIVQARVSHSVRNSLAAEIIR